MILEIVLWALWFYVHPSCMYRKFPRLFFVCIMNTNSVWILWTSFDSVLRVLFVCSFLPSVEKSVFVYLEYRFILFCFVWFFFFSLVVLCVFSSFSALGFHTDVRGIIAIFYIRSIRWWTANVQISIIDVFKISCVNNRARFVTMVVIVCETDNWVPLFPPKKKWIRHYLGKISFELMTWFENGVVHVEDS